MSMKKRKIVIDLEGALLDNPSAKEKLEDLKQSNHVTICTTHENMPKKRKWLDDCKWPDDNVIITNDSSMIKCDEMISHFFDKTEDYNPNAPIKEWDDEFDKKMLDCFLSDEDVDPEPKEKSKIHGIIRGFTDNKRNPVEIRMSPSYRQELHEKGGLTYLFQGTFLENEYVRVTWEDSTCVEF